MMKSMRNMMRRKKIIKITNLAFAFRLYADIKILSNSKK